MNPKGMIYSAKRFIGRRYEVVVEEAKAVTFDVVPGPNGEARFTVRQAVRARRDQVDGEHLLLEQPEGLVPRLLTRFDVDMNALTTAVESAIKVESLRSPRSPADAESGGPS